MKYIQQVIALLAFCMLASLSRNSFADLKICNKRTSTMFVTDVMLRPQSPQFTDQRCNDGQVSTGSSCYYSYWDVAGWYKADPGQCVTVWIGDITNRFGYVRAEFNDGAVLSGTKFAFDVQYQAGFDWDERPVLHGSSCVVGSGQFFPCSTQPVTKGFAEIDYGANKSFTLNIF